MGETTLFTNYRDAVGRPLSLLVEDGIFSAFGPDISAPDNARKIDLDGRCVIPGLVEGHIHLDKSFVGDGWHPHRPASTLAERLAIEKEQLGRAAPMTARADALIRQAAGFGTVAMRCHVDVDATTGLDHLHAVMQVRDNWRDALPIQLVAFPQAGVVACPGTDKVLRAALEEGVEVIGGLDPQGFDHASDAQLDILFDLADQYGVQVDIHLHEAAEMGIAQLGRIAERTSALGMGGRVAVSHAYCLGDVDAKTVSGTARKLADAGVSIMTNAPGDRAFPPVAMLHEAGVRMFAGNDNIRDSWWPFGNGDLLQRAMLIAYRSGFNTDEKLTLALDLVTRHAADVIGLDDYGLAVGKRADFVALHALNAAHAVASVAHDRLVIRGGRVHREA